jgi:S-formylglutathione hydrolase FrmB
VRRTAVCLMVVAFGTSTLAGAFADTTHAAAVPPAATQTTTAGPSVPAELASAVGRTDSRGLTLVSAEAVDDRIIDLTFTTPALGDARSVRVLLPPEYGTAAKRYPLLYLLHGTSGDHTLWTDVLAVQDMAGSEQMLIVMPDGGFNGEYTNWIGEDQTGAQQWETFHIGQLLPFLDTHLRTRPSREHRAIMGSSMGGLGAMEYASRHPELFSMAVPLSGAVSLTSTYGLGGVALNESVGAEAPGTIYGNRATNELNYRGHSPVDLAMNVNNTRVRIYGYNGLTAGPCDPLAPAPDPIEMGTYEMSRELHAALTRQGIAHQFNDLGPGTHTTGCFKEQAQLGLRQIVASFTDPAPAPSTVQYASTDAQWQQWGWRLNVRREAAEFSVLRDACRTGFTLIGSGAATVTTPAHYRPGSRHTVTITPSRDGLPGAGQPGGYCPPTGGNCVLADVPAPDAVDGTYTPAPSISLTAVAEQSGRLALEVPLGPANDEQEYSMPGDNRSTLKYRTQVAIAPAAAKDIAPTDSPAGTPPARAAAGATLPATGGLPTAPIAGLLLLLATAAHRRSGARRRRSRSAP